MKIDFTIAGEADVPALLAMMEQFYSNENYSFEKEKTKINLNTFLADPDLGRIWLIKKDSATIGYVVLAFGFSFEYSGRDAFIDELFLKTAFRRQGIGRLMMDFVENEAAILGINVIHLEVEPFNYGGVKLYREKGYKENGRILLSKRIQGDKEK